MKRENVLLVRKILVNGNPMIEFQMWDINSNNMDPKLTAAYTPEMAIEKANKIISMAIDQMKAVQQWKDLCG